MNLFRIKRKIEKVLGIESKQIFLSDQSEFKKGIECKIINSQIILRGNSKIYLDENVTIENCKIELENSILNIGVFSKLIGQNIICSSNSTIILKNNLSINNYDFLIEEGILIIGEHCFLIKGSNVNRPCINIKKGTLEIGEKNVLKSVFWLRFGGICKVGKYNCINEGTEIRSDESLVIGDFNMISYNCNIWDTNTHCRYDKETRRNFTLRDFPLIGAEFEKPITKPVVIGNDTWLGKNVTILKGCNIQDESVIGIGAVLSNCLVPTKSAAVGNPAKIIN